ncbi:GntR family transcriptional regulator, partial [Parasutterella excrementihominis]|uniref:GntR family transcriptional regulator n=1 Tax=Parasutterella excrementihominis TaxID=487175 RepID=UPI003FEE374D
MAHKVQPSLSNISLNHDSGAPSLQEQLYLKILDLIENKSLRPGDPIPSSRRLASEIAISRSTVVSVYNRLLEEGLLETKSGNGTFVSEISLGVFENRKE